MLKSSQFNLVKETENGKVLWNSRSGAVARMDSHAMQILEKPELADSLADKDLVDAMVQNGFLVSADENEMDRILSESDKNREAEDIDRLYYVIAPTLACNYKCVYCFENGRDSYRSMRDETVNAVIRFILSEASRQKQLNVLHVHWFGGEPLLRPDIIDKISRPLIRFCEERGIKYYASMITNGRFLNVDNANLLADLRVKQIQISFDGTKDFYCSRKRATEEDYRKTLENIKAAADILSGITIRVNVSNNEFEDARRLANEMLLENGMDGKIKYYLAATNEGTEERRISLHADFLKKETEFRQLFGTVYQADGYASHRCKARKQGCSLINKHNFCIGPDGELYKCEHHFGRAEWIEGFICPTKSSNDDVKIKENKVILERILEADHQSAQKPECAECSVFPVCFGGCHNHVLQKEKPFDCVAYREYLLNLATEKYV